jgi:hypothetical protein
VYPSLESPNATIDPSAWQKTVDRTVEKWRFAEMDVSSARNNFGGYYNAPNNPNEVSFAVLKAGQRHP